MHAPGPVSAILLWLQLNFYCPFSLFCPNLYHVTHEIPPGDPLDLNNCYPKKSRSRVKN